VTLSDAALVFLKRHIELPMQAVLDTPVAAPGFGESTRREVLAENVAARAYCSTISRGAEGGGAARCYRRSRAARRRRAALSCFRSALSRRSSTR
jgi:hypothetical protein